MKTKQFIDIEQQYAAHNYNPLPVVLTRGEGIYVWDVDGKKYMDFLSGYSAVNQGHMHPKIVKAMKEQLGSISLTSRAFYNDQLGVFCKELCELTGYEMSIPMNTGVEAVETAIKVARKWGYKKKKIAENKAEIIVFKNNFHGRTLSVVGFSSEDQYREGFGPFTPGFRLVAYNDITAFEKAISKNTVAVLIEPIQGEGGINIPTDGYLTRLAKICREKNILLMLDEIQTGLGRTGELFAYQHEKDARPDVLILGKALSGGMYPVSAVLAGKEVLGVLKPGDHGSTFGGNPLACAVARTAIRVLVDEKMVKNSEVLGKYLGAKLHTIKSPLIKEIRGKGLLIGVELRTDARKVCELLMNEGILCKETHERVLRFAPPLIITKVQIDTAFKKIKKVLERKDIL